MMERASNGSAQKGSGRVDTTGRTDTPGVLPATAMPVMHEIADVLPGAVYIFDLDRRSSTFVNAQAGQFLGYAAAEVIARGPSLLAEVLHPDDLPGVAAHFERARALRDGEPLEVEYRMRHRDGGWRWFLSRDVPYRRGADGRVAQLLGIATDITTRRLAEQRLAVQHGVASVLATATSLDDAAPQILASVGGATGWRTGGLWAVDRARGVLACVDTWHHPRFPPAFALASRAYTFARGQGLPGRVWESGVAAWVDDVQGDANFPRAEAARAAGLGAAFAFPVHAGSEVVAVLDFFATDAREPDQSVLTLLETVALQIGQFADRRAREAEADDRSARLALLARIGQQLVLRDTSDRSVLESVFGELAQALDFELFFHYQATDTPGLLVLAASGGLSEAERAASAALVRGDLLCGLVAEREAPLIIEGVAASAYAARANACARGLRCYVGLPLFAQGLLLGTVAFATRQRDCLREGDLQLMQTVCDLAAVQLARGRSDRLFRDRDTYLRLSMDAACAIAFDWDVPGDRVRRLQSLEPALPGTADGADTIADVMDAVHPLDRALFRANVERALQSTDSAYYSEFRVIRPDGAVRWLQDNGRVERDRNGSPLRLVGISHDITERKQALDRLHERQQQLAMALEAGQLGFWDWNVQTGAVSFGGRWAELLGYGLDEIEPHVGAWERLRHPDERARVARAMDDHLAGRTGFYECEHRLRHKDGSWRWVLDRGQVVDRSSDGTPLRALGTLADITTRKQAEAALHAKTQQLEALLTSAPIGVAYFDRDHRYVQINQVLAEINGVPLEHHIGRRIEDVLPVNARVVGPLLDRVVATGETVANFAFTGETPRAPGIERHWLCGFYPVRDSAGGVEMVGVWVAEITEMKRAEQALRQADRQKDEFLAMLAHELRNPLAPIRTSVGVLRTRGDDPVITRCRDVIDRQAAQMARLLDDLLDVSRLSRGRLSLVRSPLRLREVLEAAVETSRPVLDQHRHELVLDLPHDDLLLDGDGARLTQVFANLLNNAAKYSHAGGTVTLRVTTAGQEAVVRVRDQGIGIAPEMLDRVFELFAQGPEARAHAPGGLGIGLSLARRLVEMHGGRISASSAGPGCGSEFTVTLPIGRMPTEAAPDILLPEGAPPAGRRVIVADDNVDAAETIALLLEACGCEVRTVFDGESAVAEASRFRPDVVFLDLGMPGVDGYEACRRIRQEAGSAPRLIVALSGWGQQDDRTRSAEAGFDRHLTKPADPAMLIAIVREAPPAPT